MVRKYVAKQRRRLYIQEWLAERDMSQTDLAEAMETDKSNITRWISQPGRVSLDVISGIEHALQLDAGDLFRHPDQVAAVKRQHDALETIIAGMQGRRP